MPICSRRKWVVLILGVVSLLGVGPYRLDSVDPKATPSFFADKLPKLLDHWPLPTSTLKDGRPVYVRAIRTPAYDDTIGMVKHYTINAPLEQVVEATERFEDYPKVWKDIVQVKVESKDQNKFITSWIRRAPAFIMPRIRYRMLYIADKSIPGRVAYRQQLMGSNHTMKTSDGLVVYEKVSENTTRVSVVDFFDAEMGIFRGLLEGVIWRKSMESTFKDDIAFRAHLEHPDWSVDRLSKEADQTLDRFPISRVEYTELIHLQ